MNSDKTEFLNFNHNATMSSFNGKPLKLVETDKRKEKFF